MQKRAKKVQFYASLNFLASPVALNVPKTHFTLYTDEVGGGGGGVFVVKTPQKVFV
jgi:hypothetical protein